MIKTLNEKNYNSQIWEIMGFTILTIGYLALVGLIYPSLALSLLAFGILGLYKIGARWYSTLSLYILPYILSPQGNGAEKYILIALFALGAWITINSLEDINSKTRYVNPWFSVALAGLCYGIIIFVNGVRIHHNLETAAYDLGLFDNIFYNIVSGNGQLNPMERNNIDQTHFNVHFSPIFYLLAPLYKLGQRAEALIAIQALCVLTSSLALYALAKQIISKNSAAILAICWSIYTPLQGAYYYSFHEVVVGPTLLFLLGASIIKGHKILPWFLTLLLASVKEDYPILCIPAIILFGVWSNRIKLSLSLSSLLVIYFIAIKILWIIPNGENWAGRIYGDLGADNVLELIKIIITDPSKIISSIRTDLKFFNILELLVPIGLLALASPWTYFMLMGPLIVLFSPTDTVFSSNFFQYTFSTAPFLFLGTVDVLKRYNSGKQIRVAYFILLIGLIVQYNFGMLGGKPFRIGFTEITNPVKVKNHEQYQELKSILKKIPDHSIMAADDNLSPHISNRSKAYSLKYWDDKTMLDWKETEKPEYILRWINSSNLKLDEYDVDFIGNDFKVFKIKTQ